MENTELRDAVMKHAVYPLARQADEVLHYWPADIETPESIEIMIRFKGGRYSKVVIQVVIPVGLFHPSGTRRISFEYVELTE
ncbi:MAG: hypothetical protein M0R66_01220 [Candidatus Omnitrophica bacterium]|nr:hypothetical protein [Candidatus Omnitrophota bacterium]